MGDENHGEEPGEESGHITDDHIRIDIRHWESECSGLIIYRIPRKLRKVNQSAYTPQLVSIGPFHYGNDLLSEMETVKSEYYYPSFLKRFDKKIKEDDLKKVIKDCSDVLRHSYEGIPAKLLGDDDLKRVIKDCSDDLRHSYEGIPAKLLRDDDDYKLFEEMILRDACFILELFLRNVSDCEQERKRDCILRIPWLRKAIKLDLILLENQIPFFVLEKVYQVVKEHLPPVKIPSSKSSCFSSNCDSVDPHMVSSCRCFFGGTSLTCCQVEKSSPKKAADHVDQGGVCTNHCNDTLLKLTLYFFEEHYLTETCKRVQPRDIKEIKHFTDLIREFWLPRMIMSKNKPGKGAESITERKYLYSATKLDRAGVTFEPARKGTCLTDVKISKKIILKFIPIIKGMRLKLPELKLENDTESLLRNVMALEQCLYPDEDYICGYVALMDQLINTGEDVEFLVDMRILTNLLGSNKEAAKLINGLCNQIPREKSYYARFYNELNAFYENRWNVTRATLKKVYFKDLWTGSSTVVGLFVLLFTVSATLKNVYFRHL